MTNKVDFFTGIGIVTLSVLVYISASQLPVPEIGIGAGGFPKFIAICLGFLGAILSIKAIYKIRKGEIDSRKLKLNEVIQAGILAAAFALYIVLVKPFGYLITTPIFFFLFMYIYGERQWKRMILTSIIFPITVFFLFEKVFYIMLPPGSLF